MKTPSENDNPDNNEKKREDDLKKKIESLKKLKPFQFKQSGYLFGETLKKLKPGETTLLSKVVNEVYNFYWLAMGFVTVVFIAAAVIIWMVKVRQGEVIILGSGTVNEFLKTNAPSIYNGSNKAIPLEAPSTEVISVFLNAYQKKDDDKGDWKKKYPPIIGMASMDLEDSLFINEESSDQFQIWAIQIGRDELKVTLSDGTNNPTYFKENYFKEKKDSDPASGILLTQISKILNDAGVNKYTNNPSSGTFKSWNYFLKEEELPEIDTSDHTVKFLSKANLEPINNDTKNPWILLDGENYNIVGGLAQEDFTYNNRSVFREKNSSTCIRPLYIYIKSFEKSGEENSYIVQDIRVRKFIGNLLKLLKETKRGHMDYYEEIIQSIKEGSLPAKSTDKVSVERGIRFVKTSFK